MANTPTGSGSNGGTTTVVANPPNPPTTNTVPNTTTDVKKTVYQTAAENTAVNPASDPNTNVGVDTPRAERIGLVDTSSDPNTNVGADTPRAERMGLVDAASDPNTNIGTDTPRAERMGLVDTSSDPNTNVGADTPRAERMGLVDAASDPNTNIGADTPRERPEPGSLAIDDPYYGLSPTQLQDLGGADPTDPYIRARLGIPQLPGSTLNATAGFGFGNLTTNFPSIDGALGTIGSLFGGFLGGGTGGGAGVSSLFTNFASTVGGLFGGKPTASTVASTTGAGVAGLAATASTAELGKQATTVLATDSNLTPDAKENLVNIDGANAEIAKANANIEGNDNVILGSQESQAVALEQQRQAQAIIDQNNAELADDTLPDDRRAELEANNAEQRASIVQNAAVIDEAQNNIDIATANNQQQQASIAENERVAQANADAFVINNDGAGPTQVSAFEDPAAAAAERNDAANVDALVAAQGERNDAAAVDVAQDLQTERNDAAAVDAPGPGESVFDPENVDPNSDPFEEARFQAELAADVPAAEIVLTPDEQAAADEPFEARRLELEQEANREQLALEATDVEPGLFTGQTDEFGGVDEAVAIQQADIDTRNDPALSEDEIQAELDRAVESDTARDVNPNNDPGENVFNPGETINAGDESVFNPAAVNSNQDLANERNDAAATDAANSIPAFGANPDSEAAAAEAAARYQAQQQATRQARYKQPGNTDWRVRLSLAPGASYLYNAEDPGLLKPLRSGTGTDGVIFPYTPNITTTYSANYEQYDLVHSNYRGLFYKNSRVGDIQIRGTFTAQNTTEANYLLAVIHFFRSATKMFYGQDPQRGTPPPICLLNGFGGFQFSDHPVVISAFNYTLPNDVDYIRTTNPNNFGLSLANRYNPSAGSLPAGGAFAGIARLSNALLPKGAQKLPAPNNTVVGSVTNNTPASYVPTKMEIDITLIPAQTRSQISKQFSLAGFANGKLLEGGFW